MLERPPCPPSPCSPAHALLAFSMFLRSPLPSWSSVACSPVASLSFVPGVLALSSPCLLTCRRSPPSFRSAPGPFSLELLGAPPFLGSCPLAESLSHPGPLLAELLALGYLKPLLCSLSPQKSPLFLSSLQVLVCVSAPTCSQPSAPSPDLLRPGSHRPSCSQWSWCAAPVLPAPSSREPRPALCLWHN